MSSSLADPVAVEHELTVSATATAVRWPALELTLGQFLTTLGFCGLFLYHNYLPLFHSDLWGHVAYGDWMVRHQRLPVEDPLAPLAAGVPVVNSAWLSQLVLALVGRGHDVEPIAHVFAVVVVLTSGVLLLAQFRRSASFSAAVLGIASAFFVGWSRHAVQRPEMFGTLCLAALLWMIADAVRPAAQQSRNPVPFSTWRILGTLLLFAAWANLHGSFVVGWAVLGCAFLGRIGDVACSTGSLSAMVHDRQSRQWLVLIEIAIAGSLVNPDGMDLLINTLLFSGHPNLSAVLEWFPLQMVSLEGIPMGVSWIMTAAVLRYSRNRLSATEVLWLLVFSVAVCLRVRMIAWYGPILAFAMSPHVADVLEQIGEHKSGRRLAIRFRAWLQPSWKWASVAALAIWVTFAVSPISRKVLGGRSRPAHQVFSHETPLGVTAYLHREPPRGLIAAPQWWGDWLAWRGPAGIQVMATTNAIHLLPPQVWNDYLAIAQAEGGLSDRLDRYRINTVLISEKLQPKLKRSMESLAGWKIVYEDEVGSVAVRRALSAKSGVETSSQQTPQAANPLAAGASRQ